MAAQGEFRSDLYYRLNVFPISLPPLRARSEDIPALVEYFVEIFSRRLGTQIESIPLEAMGAFQPYSWPGNVRELQNLVERSVILANSGVLANPLAGPENPFPASVPQAVASAAGSTKLRLPHGSLTPSDDFFTKLGLGTSRQQNSNRWGSHVVRDIENRQTATVGAAGDLRDVSHHGRLKEGRRHHTAASILELCWRRAN